MEKPYLKRLDAPPGYGKTRFLAREAYCLSLLESLCDSQATEEQSVVGSAILVLAASSLNESRLRSELRLARIDNDGQRGGHKIHVRRLDQWLFIHLNRLLIKEGKHAELLETQEALVLLSRLLADEVPISDPLGYAARQAETARALWESLSNSRSLSAHEDVDSNPARFPAFQKVLNSFEEKTATACLFRRSQLAEALYRKLQSHLEALMALKAQYPIILVDEAQELSQEQHQLLAFLGSSLILAGNSKLSVRSYQGAAPEQLLSLDAYSNFECDDIFLDAPPDLPIKSVWNFVRETLLSNEPSSEAVSFSETPIIETWHSVSVLEEMQALVGDLKHFVSESKSREQAPSYNDCSVFLRSARYLPALQAALQEVDIPYHSFPVAENPYPELVNALIQFYRIIQGLAEEGLSAPQTEKSQLSLIVAPEIVQWEEQVQRHLEDEMQPPYWLEAFQQWQEIAPLSFIRDISAQYASGTDWFDLWLDVQERILTAFTDTPETRQILSQFHEAMDRLRQYYYRSLGLQLPLSEWLIHSELLGERFYVPPTVADIGESLEDDDLPPSVRILKIGQAQGEFFSWVAIPGMVSGEFPRLSSALSASVRRTQEEAETHLLAMGMTRARQVLRLSTHHHEIAAVGDLEVAMQVAPYFEQFQVKTKGLLALKETPLSEVLVVEASPEALQSQSLWAKLSVQDLLQPVIPNDEILNLSPSAIERYMSCPRQFYYGRLLNIPEEQVSAATFGSLLHSVMERFNRTFEAGNYTADRLSDIVRYFFLLARRSADFLAAGFSQKDWNLLQTLSELELADAYQRMRATVDDMHRKGFFHRYQDLVAIEAEYALPNFAIPGLEKVRIIGRTDALVQFADGTWEILDYKTYSASKYKASVPKCQENFEIYGLSALPGDAFLSHTKRFGIKRSLTYPAGYQLPIYYLVFNQDPRFQGRLRGGSLEILRPGNMENPEQGSIRLALSSDAIEKAAPQLLADIQNYIVNPIQTAVTFETNPDSCTYCAYTAICDVGSSMGEADEVGAFSFASGGDE